MKEKKKEEQSSRQGGGGHIKQGFFTDTMIIYIENVMESTKYQLYFYILQQIILNSNQKLCILASKILRINSISERSMS